MGSKCFSFKVDYFKRDMICRKANRKSQKLSSLSKMEANVPSISSSINYLPYLSLTLSTRGKNFSRQHFEVFFLFFPESKIQHFMQIVSIGDNLHEMSNPVFCGQLKKKKIPSICCLLKYPREWERLNMNKFILIHAVFIFFIFIYLFFLFYFIFF